MNKTQLFFISHFPYQESLKDFSYFYDEVLLEAYSREKMKNFHFASKKFKEKLQFVSDFLTFDELLDILESLDKTKEKKLVSIFLMWFRNWKDITQYSTKQSFDKFLIVIKNVASNLSTAVNQNINIFKLGFILERFSTPEEVYIFHGEVLKALKENEEKVKEREKKLKEKEYISRTYLSTKIAETPNFSLHVATCRETNQILQKQTKLCTSSKDPSNNASLAYFSQHTPRFYVAITNVKEKIKVKDDNIYGNQIKKEFNVLKKYVFIAQGVFLSIVGDGQFCCDFRDSRDIVPDLEDEIKYPHAKEILLYILKNYAKDDVKYIFDRFIDDLQSKFKPLYMPKSFLLKMHGGDESRFKHLKDEETQLYKISDSRVFSNIENKAVSYFLSIFTNRGPQSENMIDTIYTGGWDTLYQMADWQNEVDDDYQVSGSESVRRLKELEKKYFIPMAIQPLLPYLDKRMHELLPENGIQRKTHSAEEKVLFTYFITKYAFKANPGKTNIGSYILDIIDDTHAIKVENNQLLCFDKYGDLIRKL